MPMTLADAEREITALKALVVGLQRSNGTLTNRIAALEQQAATGGVQQVVDLLRPIAAYTEKILQVQAGAVGVRP